MSLIVSQDTTWAAGQPVTLTSDVQVAAGVHLTIAPGAVVNGGGHAIQAFGTVTVGGDPNQLTYLNNVQLAFGTNSGAPGVLDLDGVVMKGGVFLPNNGSDGAFDVEHTVFDSVGEIYVWYAAQPAGVFNADMFLGSSFIYAGFDQRYTAGGLSILNSYFQATAYSSASDPDKAALDVWATYGGTLQVHGNTFALPAGYKAIALENDAASVNAQGNNFGSADSQQIQNLISIHTVVASSVDTSNPLSAPSPTGPNAQDPAHYGDESLAGAAGSNSLYGGWGNDTIAAGPGGSYLRGGYGQDSLVGDAEHNDINGNQGADTIVGRSSVGDWLLGGQGDDSINAAASSGANIVNGNLGNDTILGGAGADTLRGGQGDDVIHAGSGNDWISGDLGSNTLYGGLGADTFHAGAGHDVVSGWRAGDQVQIDPGVTWTVTQVGADVHVSLSNGGEIDLSGVQVDSLPAGWLLA